MSSTFNKKLPNIKQTLKATFSPTIMQKGSKSSRRFTRTLNTSNSTSRLYTTIPDQDFLRTPVYNKLHIVKTSPQELPNEIYQRDFTSESLKYKFDYLGTFIYLMNTPAATPNLLRVNKVIGALETLANEPGTYQTEMKFIVRELKFAIFALKEDLEPEIENRTADRYTEVLTDGIHGIPYFYLLEVIKDKVQEKEEIIEQMRETITGLEAEIMDLRGKLDFNVADLKTEIVDLNEKLTNVHQEKHQQVIKGLELKEEMKKSKLYAQHKKLQHKSLKKEFEAFRTKHKTIKKQLKEVKAQLEDQKAATKQKQTTLEELQKIYHTLQLNHKILIGRCSKLKQKTTHYEDQIRELDAKYYHLSMTSSVGFDDLTPRPSVVELFETLSIPAPKYETTTKEAIQTVINVYRDRQAEQNQKLLVSQSPNSARRPSVNKNRRGSTFDLQINQLDMRRSVSSNLTNEIASFNSMLAKTDGK